MEQKTPLYENHLKLEGKLVPFAGYLLPVQYPTGIIKEHLAVRTEAGLFDCSHMGEFIISGKDALQNINYILTNDFSSLAVGRIRYTLMCNDHGGIIDDLIVYRMGEHSYMLVVNASNRQTDYRWIKSKLEGDVTLKDDSDSTALMALQGPKSKAILLELLGEEQLPDKYYSFKANILLAGASCLISRTGYTGELGYEIYTDNASAATVWEALLDKGQAYGLIPCGLGARDTLRFEASMPLYGNEMTEDISPLEVGLEFAVKLSKDDFIGKQALEERPPTRRRIGVEVTGRGIVREHEKLFIGDRQVGITTSGTHTPYLKKALAMALVDSAYATEGTEVLAEVRGRMIPARLITLPFIKK